MTAAACQHFKGDGRRFVMWGPPHCESYKTMIV